MEERTKRFELLSDLYHFLLNLPPGSHGSELALEWVLKYGRIGPEKLFLAGFDRGAFVPLAEVGGSSKNREIFRGTVIHHMNVVRQTQEVVMYRDLSEDGDELLRDWAMKEEIRTFWIFPVMARDRVLGTMGVAYGNVRELNDLERQYWTRVTETLAMLMALAERRYEHEMEQEQFSVAMELSQAGVAGFWTNGEVAFHNQRFLDLFHLQSEDVRGHYRQLLKRIRDQMADPDLVDRELSDALRNPSTHQTFELVADLKGVLMRKIRMRLRPLVADGVVDGWIAIFEDCTQEYAVKTQQEAFLSLVAHEFRTPITVIAGVVEWLLAETTADPIMQEQIRMVSRESTRLMRLIREVWLSVHLDDPTWPMDPAKVCVAEVVREESTLRQSFLPLKRISYTGPDHAHVWANREIVTTIVSVLLSNAVRFSGIDASVEASVEVEQDFVRVDVRDGGPGVDEAVATDLFLRMPDPRKRSAMGGIGIGLWLSRQLLDRMGGDIHYHPRAGGGSVFTVRFPRRPGNAPPSAGSPQPEPGVGPI